MIEPPRTLEPSPASPNDAPVHPPSARARWAGRVMSGLAVLFLSFDAVIKVLLLPAAVQGTVELGYPVGAVRGIGVVELVLLAVYLFPHSSVVGAVLWTGYLGGAVASHVRLEAPLFSHVLFPVYVACLLWGGLWLRDRRARFTLSLTNRAA